MERVFSRVACIKTKLRNRLSLKMLDAIVRIRTYLLLNDQCCKDFVVTREMLGRFNSEILYAKVNDESEFDISALNDLY